MLYCYIYLRGVETLITSANKLNYHYHNSKMINIYIQNVAVKSIFI